MSPREVPKNFTGPHLIFSSMGDDDNDPNGCWSYVGRQGAQGGKAGQTVNLGSSGCFFIGTVVHEIMHGLGQYQLMIITSILYSQNNPLIITGATHEQNRADRDDFVIILMEEVEDDAKKNFEKKDALFSSRNTPYDYASLMHYSDQAFSKSDKKTIIPLLPNITLR